jgi:hypothetical protein
VAVPPGIVITCTTATQVNATKSELPFDAAHSAGVSSERRHNILPYPDVITDSDMSMLSPQELTPTQLHHVKLADIASHNLMERNRLSTWAVTLKRLHRFQPQELLDDDCVSFGLGRIQDYLDSKQVDATKVVLADPLLWTAVRDHLTLRDEGRLQAAESKKTTIMSFLPRKESTGPLREERRNLFASAETVILIASGGNHFTTVVVSGMNRPREKPSVVVLDSLTGYECYAHSLDTIRRCLQALADVVWEATGTPTGVPRFLQSR